LEDFGESVFIDDVCMEGTDRRVVYAMVDCHDDRMIPKSIMVHAGDKWEIVFVRVIDWALVGAPPPLENDHLYGRNQNREFRAEAQARKSLARGMDRLRGYFNRFGGPNAESTDEEQDMMEEGMVAKEIEVKFARGGGWQGEGSAVQGQWLLRDEEVGMQLGLGGRGTGNNDVGLARTETGRTGSVGDGPVSTPKEIEERGGVASVGRLMWERTKGEGDQIGVTPLIVVREHATNKTGARVGIRRRLFPTSGIVGPVALADGKL
jgi:hypothetical protein